MKFGRCNAASLENSEMKLVLRDGDTFVVKKKFESNPAFIEGLRVGNLEIITVDTVDGLKKVIGMTEDYIQEFIDSMEAVDDALVDSANDESIDNSVAIAEFDQEVPDEPAPPVNDESVEEEQPPVDTDEKVPEVHEENTGDDTEPVLAFTEKTDSWQKAVALVKKETDAEKIAFALRKDERKSVQKACVERLAELSN